MVSSINMEIVLTILAFLFLLVGLLGSVVPALPGPPLSFIGLLLLQWSGKGGFSVTFLVVLGLVTAAITVMDNILPAIITKKFGGSRLAVTGSIVGLIIGMIFFAPIGILLGPFLGALLGELLNNMIKNNSNNANRNATVNAEPAPVIAPVERAEDTPVIAPAVVPVESQSEGNVRALKVAMGAFLAFIVGTGAKLILGSMMIYYAIQAVFK